MHPVSEACAGIAFGRFLLLPHRRELLADGRPVKLGGRAFDVLMALIEARGAVVSKNALMARVWPDRIVEENNLQWQISALRAAFGADRNLIRTVSGRGYQITAEIDTVYGSPEADPGTAIAAAQPDLREARPDEGIPGELPPTNLPEPISELIGRDDVLAEILSLAAAHRLVTLTGAGGIGKTRLALAAARRLLPQFNDGVWLAEFSPIADPGLVPATVAAAIALDLGGGEVSAQRVARALANRRLLLILDTCEHVVGAAAAIAEAVLRAGSTVRLIATSREPLRAEGEWVYPVPPLAIPAEDAADADDLLRYGGVRLFVERLRAAEPHFAPDRCSAAMIAAVCRRLDGIPLAIELAAARAAVLGVEDIATHLDDRFRILTGGRRTALPRHQTLRATLDWSYELLSEPERVILRRLAVFAGVFRLAAASAIIASGEIAPADIVDGIANLVAKSLVTVGAGDGVARYRLLDTMRAYAFEKLTEAEHEQLARRHADYYRHLFERSEAEEARSAADWLAEYGPKIDNLRAALDWAFSPRGDASVGVALTAAAAPLWMHLSLLEECRRRVEQALAALPTVTGPDPRQEMKLLAALGASRLYTRGGVPEVAAAWTKALELAKSLDDTEYQKRATGLRLLRSCFQELGETGITAPRFMRFAAAYMAEGLGKAGQVADALDAIDDAIARAERTEELWQFPELLRVKGELVLLQGAAPQAAAAEDYFEQALDWARRQGAQSWELRAAASLARLLCDQGRSADAVALLQPVYDRFTEGFETADLKAAKALLNALQELGVGVARAAPCADRA